MRKFILIFWSLFLFVFMYGQQDMKISHYMFDHIGYNPGSAGSADMVCANIIAKQQWLGFEGAPQNLTANVNAPFNLFGASHGVGLSIYDDTWGFNTDIDLKLSYAYRIPIKDGKLGIGISASFLNRALDPDWVIPMNDFHIQPEDDAGIPQGKQNLFAFDMGAGLFYKTENIYMGISATHLLSPVLKYPDETGTSRDATEKLKPHYYFTAGYTIQMPNPSFEITPSVLVATDAKIVNMDLNALVVYNKKIWGGVTYRPTSEIVGMVGLEIINGLKVSYAYDFQTSALINNSKGSHEIMLNYCFNLGVVKTPQKYKSIRYL